MRGATLGFLVLWGAFGQDEKKEVDPVLRGDVVRALKQAAQTGSYEVSGELKTEVRDNQTDEEPTLGRVTGQVIASPFQAALRVKADQGTHELYYKEGKLVGRLVWRAVPVDLGKSPSELLSLVNLDRLALYAEKATLAQAGTDEKIGDRECRRIRLRLPGDTIRGHSQDNDAQEEDEKGLDRVEAELFLDKARGNLVRLQANVRRVYKDGEDPLTPNTATSSYQLDFQKMGEAKVRIPKEIEREFEE
jgi:hypothetical protein